MLTRFTLVHAWCLARAQFKIQSKMEQQNWATFSFFLYQLFRSTLCKGQSRHFHVKQAKEIRGHILGILPCHIERGRGIRNTQRLCRSLCRRWNYIWGIELSAFLETWRITSVDFSEEGFDDQVIKDLWETLSTPLGICFVVWTFMYGAFHRDCSLSKDVVQKCEGLLHKVLNDHKI